MQKSIWKYWEIILLILAGLIPTLQADQLNLIPWPAKIMQLPGQFKFDIQTVVAADPIFTNEAALLEQELHLSAATKHSKNRIRLTTQGADGLGDEAYRLEVGQTGVTIRALSTAGAFYGCQTLRQLLAPKTRAIPFVQIEDAPRYAWRGLMLDVSRHFFDEATIRRMIDWMADYKLNRLHLHLTDDEAWRLEIGQYPKLTQVGARGNFLDPNAPALFFMRDQIRSIIAYAAQRHIVVVPEIDLPGHAGAAIRAFPQFDVGVNTFNPANPEACDFLQNVLLAVMDDFPSPWIHIGGDEVKLNGWRRNVDVIKKLQAGGLKQADTLEIDFMNRMAEFVKAHGRIPMGWDEIVHGKPDTNTVIFWWRHDKPEVLSETLAAGYPVVLSPRAPCYFNYPQDASYPPNPKSWNLINTPENVYAGPTIPAEIPAEQRKQILGIEGCVWSEQITTMSYLEFMIMPRMIALSEVAWTPDEQRDYGQFNERLKSFLKQYHRAGIYYYDQENPGGSLDEAKNPKITCRSAR